MDDVPDLAFDTPVLLECVSKRKRKLWCEGGADGYVVVSRGRARLGPLDETAVVTFRGGLGAVPLDQSLEVFTNYGAGPCVLGTAGNKLAWAPHGGRWFLRCDAPAPRYGDGFKLERDDGRFVTVDRSGVLELGDEADALLFKATAPTLKFAVTWKARCSSGTTTTTTTTSRRRNLFVPAAEYEGPSFVATLPLEVCAKVLDFASRLRDVRALRAACSRLATLATSRVAAVRVSDFDPLPSYQRKALVRWAVSCPNLVSLNLMNLDALRDPELAPLASLARTLEILNLGGCVRLTDRALDNLTLLPGLVVLNLATTAVSAHALALACASWPRLAKLNVYGKRGFFDDDPAASLAHILSNAPTLECLNARDTGLLDAHVRAAAPRATVLTGDRPGAAAPSLYCDPIGV